MENILVANVVVFVGVAFVAAIVLYWVAKKFAININPLINEVDELLPQANCGACSKAGCLEFAKACVASSKEEFVLLYCPVGGKKVMSKIADKLGYVSQEKQPSVAVLRCNGTCQNAPDKVDYVGLKSCRLASRLFVGKTGCPDGCLRFGDCVITCPFGAISINKQTLLPEVDAKKCTSCGKCVKTCPRDLYEIRTYDKDMSMVYVACNNKQKGAIAKKNCNSACIACTKCTKVCADVVISDNLSHINTKISSQEYGKHLAESCPTKAIIYKEASNEQA